MKNKRIIVLGVALILFALIAGTVFAQSVYGDAAGLNSNLLNGLIKFAEISGKTVNVTEGVRSQAEQDRLWNQRLAEGGHVNNDPKCTITGGKGDGLTVHSANENRFVAKYSKHANGNAADISVNGANPTRSDCANLNKAGLGHTVATEMWHVEYTDGSCLRH
jgi:hypothetical protein